MDDKELDAWESSAGYWVSPDVPMFGIGDRLNIRKQSKRVLALIAEVRRLQLAEVKLLGLLEWQHKELRNARGRVVTLRHRLDNK